MNQPSLLQRSAVQLTHLPRPTSGASSGMTTPTVSTMLVKVFSMIKPFTCKGEVPL